jgi:hypothetical protein
MAKRQTSSSLSDKPSSGVEREKLSKSFKEGIHEPSTESATPSPKKQKQTAEASQEETSEPLDHIISLPFLANQPPVMEGTAPVSPDKHKQTVEVPLIETSELLEHTSIHTFPTEQVGHLRRTREEKGKNKVGDNMPPIMAVTDLPAISEAPKKSTESPLSGIVTSGTELAAIEIPPRDETETEPTGMTTKSYSYDMPEALKIDFLSSLIKTKKLIQRKQPISLDSSNTRLPEKATIIEEHNPLVTISPSDIPTFPASPEILPLSELDRETERYLERILSGMATEGPFARISPNVEEARKNLGLEHGGATEVEAATIKDASTSVGEKGETRTISIADYESRLRREGSIASQAAMDTPPAGGSTSGQTLDAIYWSIGDTLSRLGEKWLGNPLTALAGLIPAPTLTEVKAMTSQETADHMMFHLADVSASRFELISYLYFENLFPSLFRRAS